jgi:thiosulfate reductase cytochrome b subunit
MTNKSLWIKIWHWTNGILCVLLIITGLNMQYSGSSFVFIDFEGSVAIHNLCGILLTLSFIGFIMGNITSNNIAQYKIRFSELKKDLWIQARYYAFGIFKGEQEPYPVGNGVEFNPLQKVSYVIVMYFFVPMLIFTGIAMIFPEIIAESIFGFTGFFVIDILHVIIAFLVSVFLIIHIYFAYFHGFNKTH